MPPPHFSMSSIAIQCILQLPARRELGFFFYGPQPRLPNQKTAIVIEYSIGEPFSKSGNGIRLCTNVLCRRKRSHHHFAVQAVLKEHLACHLSGPRVQNDTDFPSSSVVCVNVLHLIFSMVISLIFPSIPQQPSP